jgi:RNase adaptor protein for sRNA GlmZ degradation
MSAGSGPTKPLHVILFSFGFKYGMPTALNFLWDVRFLPNPYWVEALRPRTGLDKVVADYVIKSETGQGFLQLIEPLVLFLVEKSILVQRQELFLAIGCTGGRHRSVAVVEALQQILRKQPVELTVFHRDIEND